MPLTSIRLKNFKCFADSGEIPLAPLTVIFGRNNTGKSSILQSLLLLRQSARSADIGPRLNLRGPGYSAGTYFDVVHQHRAKEHLILECGVHPPKLGRDVTVRMEFQSDEPHQPRLARLTIEVPGNPLVEFRRGRGAGGPYELSIGDKKLGGEKTGLFYFHPARFFPFIRRIDRLEGKVNGENVAILRNANGALYELNEVLTAIRSVGAFRQQPERRYEFHGRLAEGIEPIGESVVAALIEDTIRRRKRGRGELLTAVNRWLKQVGRVRLLPLRRISKAARIYELRLRDTDSGRWANFADVGFGIGQAFPVIVEGLRTPAGGTFLVQEPEIHLHPDAQLAMADFLVYLVRSDRRVIVESHSEHLLLRIRHRIARRRQSGLASKDVSVVYIDKSSDGASAAHVLRVDKLGQIENWPKGFMEDAAKERIALLEAAAARSETG